jgi:YD repeat-containing protein
MTTFGAWDALGRPTTQTASRAICTGETWAISYDDAARRTTARILSAGSGAGCAPSAIVSTVDYDADGNITRETFALGGVTTRTQTNTITSAESVCL